MNRPTINTVPRLPTPKPFKPLGTGVHTQASAGSS